MNNDTYTAEKNYNNIKTNIKNKYHSVKQWGLLEGLLIASLGKPHFYLAKEGE